MYKLFTSVLAVTAFHTITAQIVPFPYAVVPVTGGNCLQGMADCPERTPFLPLDSYEAQGQGLLPSTASAATPVLPVTYTQGTTTGAVTSNNVVVYYGVPYAQNNIRFSPPEPAAKLTSIHDGTSPYPDCVQHDGTTGVEFNCLHFDIYVPIGVSKPAGGWPVYVYYPGGSFVDANSISFANIVGNTQGFIALRGTYRVGPFGYLATAGASKEFGQTIYSNWINPPQLTKKNTYQQTQPIEASGMYGVMDQIQGLRWVQQNIAYFGGNPAKVTVGGESAGSWSVCQLISSPLTNGLFHQAILESGNCDSGPAGLLQYLGHQEQMGQLVGTLAGCDLGAPDINGNYTKQLQCLRSVTAYNLTQANINAGGEVIGIDHMTTPVVDGYVHASAPQSAFWSGQWTRVPVLAGTNLFETYVFDLGYIQNTPGFVTYDDVTLLGENYTTAYSCAPDNGGVGTGGCPYTDQNAINQLQQIYGPSGTTTLTQYGPELGPYYSINSAGTQGIFSCGMRRIASYANTWSGKNSYLYAFALRGNGIGAGFGPVHSFELQWVYGNAESPGFTPEEQQMSYVMQSYWANWIMNGDPNNNAGNALAATGADRTMPSGYTWLPWPTFDGTSALVFGDQGTIDNFTLTATSFYNIYPQCPLWDQTMPGATNHGATLFAPRPYTGYNQPGFGLSNPNYASAATVSTTRPATTAPATTPTPTAAQGSQYYCSPGFSLTGVSGTPTAQAGTQTEVTLVTVNNPGVALSGLAGCCAIGVTNCVVQPSA